ncbi:MAG: hypothetical protein J6M17_08185 [Ruminococcus sp.]|nr:hypothetical protein [Ruminococcus sp.]
MQTNNKIERLKKKLSDKTLKRSERSELMNELYRERYKIDPRKPISVRKQKILDAVMNLILGAEFMFMGISGMMDLNHTHHQLNLIISIGWLAALIGLSVIYTHTTAKYKKEPEDELSAKNTSKAYATGYTIMSLVVLLAAFVYFDISGQDVFYFRRNFAVFLIAGYTFLTRVVCNVIFLILEGKEDSEEEE